MHNDDVHTYDEVITALHQGRNLRAVPPQTDNGDMSSETKRKEYTDEYLMEDGDFVYGPKELKTWLEANVPAVEYKVKREIVF